MSPLLARVVLAVLCAVVATAAAKDVPMSYGVGFTRASIADPMGGRMQYSLWYPTLAPQGIVKLGAFRFAGTRDAEPADGPFGLVVISHGTGGSDLGHRDIAIALAKAGFLAAAPLHPRDNFRDASGVGERIVWEGRPRQLSAVIDELLGSETWSPRIDATRIGAFGFSLGGYTVLAALGATPDLPRVIEHCRKHRDDDPFCRLAGNLELMIDMETLSGLHDTRICAAVVADPVVAPFSDETLRSMPSATVVFYRPEHETVLAARYHVLRVIEQLKLRDDFPEPEDIVVPKAGHYSFISPFPDSIARRYPSIASDRVGFDRTAFHAAMSRNVAAFFEQALASCLPK